MVWPKNYILIGIFSKMHDPQKVKNDIFKRTKAWPITNGSSLTLLWSQWSSVKKSGQTSQPIGGNLHMKPVVSQFQWEEVGRVLKNESCIKKKQQLFWFKEGLTITLQNISKPNVIWLMFYELRKITYFNFFSSRLRPPLWIFFIPIFGSMKFHM